MKPYWVTTPRSVCSETIKLRKSFEMYLDINVSLISNKVKDIHFKKEIPKNYTCIK